MNAYEEKRAARIERLRARADKRAAEASAAFKRSDQITDRIPMGQPILVGHHSERRHRRDLERSDRAMRAGIEASKDARELDRRADAAESNDAIFSDDPEAVVKLRTKLANLEKVQARMVAANKALRAGKSDEEIAAAAELPVARVAELRQPDFCGRTGFAGFELSNNSAEIRRTKKRIAELEAKRDRLPPPPETYGEIQIEEAENRVRLFFPGKPSDTVREALKRRGFRWAPSEAAWQRHASPGAWYDAREVARSIAPTEPPPAPETPAAADQVPAGPDLSDLFGEVELTCPNCERKAYFPKFTLANERRWICYSCGSSNPTKVE